MTPSDASAADSSHRQRLTAARKAFQGALTRPESLIPFLTARVGEAHLSRAAAALSFSTALAVVPALALVLATLAAFPVFNELRAALQGAIVTNLVPDTGMKVSDALVHFIEAAGKLTAFGVIGLVLTAILLLLTIEGALNEIFRVTRPRLLRQRLLVFWAVMTIGPILLGSGFSLLGYFAGQQVMLEGDDITRPITVVMLGNLMPTLLTWATLAILFVLVPNRRLKLKDALIGAAVAAVLLAVLRYSFALYIIFMTSYQAIYGAIAAVPVFLVWIYLVWLAVLSGAVVTSALPDWRYMRSGIGTGVAGRMGLALEILARLAIARRDGLGVSTEQLAKLLGAPDNALSAVLNELRTGLFIAPTEDGRWLLSRDLERTPLADLVHHFGLGLNLTMPTGDTRLSDLEKRLSQHLRNAAESERTLLSVSLARVVSAAEETPTA
jgi:membrane protein